MSGKWVIVVIHQCQCGKTACSHTGTERVDGLFSSKEEAQKYHDENYDKYNDYYDFAEIQELTIVHP